METKSRYEVIAELEHDKRNLIKERDSFDSVLKMKERELKELKRCIEDKEEEIANFKESMKTSRETITELIKTLDESLNRFSKLNEKRL